MQDNYNLSILLSKSQSSFAKRMETQEINPKYWCKFEAFDWMSLTISIGMFVIQCLLLGLYAYSLKIRKNNKIYTSTSEVFLFKIITVWFTTIYAKSLINICVFFIYVQDQDRKNERSQIILSAITLFLDRMGSFVLHTLLIKIPCIWIKNITMKLQHKQLNLKQMKRADRIFKVLNIMDKYFTLRLIIILINLAFDIYFCFYPNFGQYSRYLTVITLIEASVAISIYTFGILTLKIFEDLFSIPKKIKNIIILEYACLMICCLSRLIFNTLFYLIPWHANYSPLENCRERETNFSSNFMNYFYISVVFFMIHIVPILTIILVYWPQTRKIQSQQSLINSTSSDLIYSGSEQIKVLSNNYLLGSNRNPIRSFSPVSNEPQLNSHRGDSIFK